MRYLLLITVVLPAACSQPEPPTGIALLHPDTAYVVTFAAAGLTGEEPSITFSEGVWHTETGVDIDFNPPGREQALWLSEQGFAYSHAVFDTTVLDWFDGQTTPDGKHISLGHLVYVRKR